MGLQCATEIANKALESCNLINTYVKVLDMTYKPL